MTIASECVLAGELGSAYAAVCIGHNYANGVGRRPLHVDKLEAATQGRPRRARPGARSGAAGALA